MRVRGYQLDIFAPPCDPGAERWSVKAALDDDIGEVLPFLNSALKGAIYNHAARALTWRMGGHTSTIRPTEIVISNLRDRASAETEVKRIVNLVNGTWERRTDIAPSIAMRPRLKPMEVYKLLPATNCKACRQATCFTFALKVTAGECEPEQCSPLATEAYREKREKLLALLEGAMN